jgi:hypothetical protein
MKSITKTNKYFLFCSLSILLLLLIASIYFYKERMLFIDPIWIVYNISETNFFSFAEHRYGAFITQIVPLIGVLCGVSLKYILIAYSASFYLFYIVSFCVIAFKWKQYQPAILLALYSCTFISDGYFWPNNEIHQGVCWLMLFVGYFQYVFIIKKHITASSAIISFLFLILAISCHVLIIPIVFFIWVLVLVQLFSIVNVKLNYKILLSIATTCVILVCCYLKYYLSSKGWYDPQKMETVQNLKWGNIPSILNNAQSNNFIKLLFSNYWSIILWGVTAVIYGLKKKQFILLMYKFLGILAYYIIICATFPEATGRSFQFYIESEWAVLAIIFWTPIIMFNLLDNMNKTLFISLLLIFFGSRMYSIYQSSHLFTNRIHALKTISQFQEEEKMAKAVLNISEQNSKQYFLMSWGLPIETMAYAIIEGKTIRTMKVFTNTNTEIPKSNTLFFSCFSNTEIEKMRPPFIGLSTNDNYRTLDSNFIEKLKPLY